VDFLCCNYWCELKAPGIKLRDSEILALSFCWLIAWIFPMTSITSTVEFKKRVSHVVPFVVYGFLELDRRHVDQHSSNTFVGQCLGLLKSLIAGVGHARPKWPFPYFLAENIAYYIIPFQR